METISPETLLTSHQVGELLQINPSTVVKWVNDEILPAYRTAGGHRRIQAADLLSFLHGQRMYIPAVLRGAGPMRLLLVDDDHAFLESFKRAFKAYSEFISLTCVDSGIEALILLGAVSPGAIVLDVNMPGINGIEVCRRIKANELTKKVTVVMASGDASPQLEAEVLQAGGRALLAKPITPKHLLHLLDPAALQSVKSL